MSCHAIALEFIEELLLLRADVTTSCCEAIVGAAVLVDTLFCVLAAPLRALQVRGSYATIVAKPMMSTAIGMAVDAHGARHGSGARDTRFCTLKLARCTIMHTPCLLQLRDKANVADDVTASCCEANVGGSGRPISSSA